MGWKKKGCPPVCTEPKPTECSDCEKMSKDCQKIHLDSCKALQWDSRKGCPPVCTMSIPNHCDDCEAMVEFLFLNSL